MLDYLDSMIGFAAVFLMLSLMLTTAVQMLNSLLGMRSRVLKIGFERIAAHCLGKGGDDLKTLVESWRTDPLLKHGFFGPDAVKRGEMLRLVGQSALKEAVVAATGKGADPEAMKMVQTFVSRVTAERLQTDVKGVTDEIGKLAPGLAANVQQTLDAGIVQASAAVGHAKDVFDHVMDRISDVFRLRCRIITAGMALVATFVLHIDAGYIFNQILTNPSVRKALIQESGGLVTDSNIVAALTPAGLRPLVTNALAGTFLEMKIAGAVTTAVPESVVSCVSAQEWIHQGAGGLLPEAGRQEVCLSLFEKKVSAASAAEFEASHARFEALQRRITKTGLEIAMNNPPPFLSYFCSEAGFRHFLGLLATAVLLSMGAPFWFNTLKELVGLRSQVAQRSDDRAAKA
jgi:hypothetical protein